MGLLTLAPSAGAARTYTDPGDDVNAAPDITSVEVSESTPGVLGFRLVVANYQSLPDDSWVNIWFDADSNSQTGDAGDEVLVRYLADGSVQLFMWNGSQLAERPTTGVAGSFAAGVLEISVPRTAVDVPGPFALLVVSSRRQTVGTDSLVASDFVPNVGRSPIAGVAASSVVDAAGDHDQAPDVASIRVSDAKDGWLSFAITTPNYETLPDEEAIVLSIDTDGNPKTGDFGAEARLNTLGGEILMQRWEKKTKEWVEDELPTRARVRNANHVITIDVHASELANPTRIGFSILSADLNSSLQTVLAVDFAPDDDSYYPYTLTNKPAVTLHAARLVGTPSRPHAGKPFVVSLGVTRSDTHRGITSGSVSCSVSVGGHKVPAHGSVVGGAGRCSFVVPADVHGALVRGTITVRSGGKTVSSRFAYHVV